MKNNPKRKKLRLYHGLVPDISKLKAIWREQFTEAEREHWRRKFMSGTTQLQIRLQMKKRLGLDLSQDTDLTRLRAWDQEQQELDAEAERQALDEKKLYKEHPEWTKDQLRDQLLLIIYRRARASGNFRLGLAAMQRDQGTMKLALEREKFEYDAARAAREHAPKIKAISADDSLTEDEKIDLIREELWGMPPAE